MCTCERWDGWCPILLEMVTIEAAAAAVVGERILAEIYLKFEEIHCAIWKNIFSNAGNGNY